IIPASSFLVRSVASYLKTSYQNIAEKIPSLPPFELPRLPTIQDLIQKTDDPLLQLANDLASVIDLRPTDYQQLFQKVSEQAQSSGQSPYELWQEAEQSAMGIGPSVANLGALGDAVLSFTQRNQRRQEALSAPFQFKRPNGAVGWQETASK